MNGMPDDMLANASVLFKLLFARDRSFELNGIDRDVGPSYFLN